MVVKEMLRRHKLQITLIQESKLKEVTERIMKEIWGSRFIGWVAVEVVGSAGGLCYCGTRSVKILNSWSDVFSVSVLVDDCPINQNGL